MLKNCNTHGVLAKLQFCKRLTFKSDLLFKMLFARNQHLLKRLVAVMLKIEPYSKSFAVTNSEIVPEEIDTKFCRLDLRMNIGGDIVILEIQAQNRGSYPDRTLYYWAREFSSALAAGEDYAKLPRVIVMSITGFTMHGGNEVHSKFAALEEKQHEKLTDKLSLHYFELPKFETYDAKDELSLWLALFNAETEDNLEKLLK